MHSNARPNAFASLIVLTIVASGIVTTLAQPSIAQTGSQAASQPVLSRVPPVPQANAMMAGVTPGHINRSGYTAYNPPPQPQVAASRCQTCYVGIDCADNCGRKKPQTWRDLHPYNFGPLAHGEWLGPVRVPSNMDYRVRVGDQIRFTYIAAREHITANFLLRPGDQLQITSTIDETLQIGDLTQGRGAEIQQDGMIYLDLVGSVRAAGLTINQLQRNLEMAYGKLINNPAINVMPIKTNTLLQDILDSVDNRAGNAGGQTSLNTVVQDGTIRLPKLGPICVLGLTLDEVKREVNLRYREKVSGLEVETSLEEEAPHFVFVYGEVAQPGRFELQGPTSVTQALALAQGVELGGNTRQIVIFRRAEDWRLLATKVDLRGAHLGKTLPTDEIWLRDGDLIIVPKTPIQRIDDFVQQVFTNGLYGVFPFAQIGSGLEVGAGAAVVQ